MSVLAPLYMLAAFALAGPVLLHLMRQRPRRVLVFSSLQFLHATPVRPRTRRRVDDWLLLALRLTAIGLLVAAFVRPVWHAHTVPANGPAPRHSILLDRSASMHRGDAWPAALAAVAAELKESPADASVEVLAFDAAVEPLLTFEESSALPPPRRAAVVAARLRDRGPSHGPTRLDRALKHLAVRMAETIRSAQPARPWTVTVITDGRSDAILSELDHVAWPTNVRVGIRVVGWRSSQEAPLRRELTTSATSHAATTAREAPGAATAVERLVKPQQTTFRWRPVPRSDDSALQQPTHAPGGADSATAMPLASGTQQRPSDRHERPANAASGSAGTLNAVIQPVFDAHTHRLQKLLLRTALDPPASAAAPPRRSVSPNDRKPARPPHRTLRILVEAQPVGTTDRRDLPAFALNVVVPVAPGSLTLPPLPEELRHEPALVVELSGDDAIFDNRCFIARPHAAPLRIAFVDGRPPGIARDPESAGYFLQRACEASGGRLALLEDWIPRPDDTTSAAPDLVIADGAASLEPTDTWRRLLDRGVTLMIVLQTAADAATCRELLGWTDCRAESVEDIDFATWASRVPHPVWMPFGLRQPLDFSQVRFWRYVRLAVPDSVRILARFDNGDPALVEDDRRTGRVLLLASGWSLRDSQLALSTQFVPWLIACAEYAAGRAPERAMFEVGEPIERSIDRRRLAVGGSKPANGRSDAGSIAVRTPDGTVERCAITVDRSTMRFPATATPGHYVLEYPGGRREIVAVNVPLAESTAVPLAFDPQTASDAAAREPATSWAAAPSPASGHDTLPVRLRALGIAATYAAGPGVGQADEKKRSVPEAAAGRPPHGASADSATLTEWRRAALYETESRQRLWWWCVTLAVIALFVETGYAARRSGASRATARPPGDDSDLPSDGSP